LIYLIIFICGFSSLYYEVIVLKLCEIHLGISIFTAGTVLLGFMSGILFGNIIASRIASSRERFKDISVLILVELCLTATVMFTPWLISQLAMSYLRYSSVDYSLFGRLTLKYGLTLLALLPLSIASGTRFPLVLRTLSAYKSLDRLYGWACLGSAAGALLAGMLIFQLCTVTGAWWLAAGCGAINILLLLQLSHKKNNSAARTSPRFGMPLVFPHCYSILALLFLLGMLTIGFELLWVRCFLSKFPNIRYLFSVVTAVVLSGMFAGTLLCRFIPLRLNWLLSAFGLLGVLVQLGVGINERFYLFGNSATAGLWQFAGSSAVAVAIVVTAPAMLLGMLFPALIKYAEKKGEVNLTTVAVATNNAGAVCGAVLLGGIMLQLFGYRHTVTIITAALLLFLVIGMLRAFSLLKLGAVLVLLFIYMAGCKMFYDDPPLKDYYRLAKITGADADAEIYERKNFDTPNRLLVLNRIFVSGGSGYMAARLQRRQSLIPLLLYSGTPRRVLTISLATGITASGFTRADIEQVDVVELLPSSVKLAGYFSRENGDITSRSNFTLILEDGRIYIRKSIEKYDIILSDNYQYSAAATPLMYTVEAFQAAGKALRNNGIFVQWLPLKQIPPEHLDIIIHTFHQVFPDGELYFNDIIRDEMMLGLVGYKTCRTDDNTQIKAYRRNQKLYSQAMFAPAGCKILYVGSAGEYCHRYPTTAVNSYNIPLLEKYYTSRVFVYDNLKKLFKLYEQQPDGDIGRAVMLKLAPVLNARRSKNYVRALTLLDSLLAEYPQVGKKWQDIFPEVDFLRGELATALAAKAFSARRLSYCQYYLDIAEKTKFRSARMLRLQGIMYGLSGQIMLAEHAFSAALAVEPRDLRVYESRALIYAAYGRRREALEDIASALKMPYPDPVILRTALIVYMKTDAYKKIAAVFSRYLKLSQQDPKVIRRVSDYLKRKGLQEATPLVSDHVK
jgi:spermidine synthase